MVKTFKEYRTQVFKYGVSEFVGYKTVLHFVELDVNRSCCNPLSMERWIQAQL